MQLQIDLEFMCSYGDRFFIEQCIVPINKPLFIIVKIR